MIATSVKDCSNKARGEIRDHEDLHSVGSSEASWHTFNFSTTARHPPVKALRVHLEEQQQVVFDEGSEIESLETQRHTELTAFFTNNEKKI